MADLVSVDILTWIGEIPYPEITVSRHEGPTNTEVVVWIVGDPAVVALGVRAAYLGSRECVGGAVDHLCLMVDLGVKVPRDQQPSQ